MKIVILQENLKSALFQLQKAIPSKPQLPILASVLLSATKTDLSFSATDLYFGIRTRVMAQVTDPTTVAVPAEIFKQLVGSLPAGQVELITTETNLTIKTATTKAQIPLQNGAEFPQFPDVAGTQIEFSATEIQTIVTQTSYANSTDVSRPVLTALLFNFQETSLEVVGTDGFRLAVLKLPSRPNLEDQKVLLPAKALQEIQRIAQQLKTKQLTAQLDPTLKQAKFLLDNTEEIVRMIAGEFPPYEKIIPQEAFYQIEIDRETMLEELKRAQLFTRETSNIVKLVLESEKLSIQAKSPSFGEYVGEISVKNPKPEKLEIAFNVNYLIDFFSAQDSLGVTFSATESLKPATFKPEGEKNFFYVVMPFRVSE